MQSHEYRVILAPRRGAKVKGLRTPEERFAHAVEGEMNRMALEGWEFVRSDTLPCEVKPGWFSRPVTVSQTLLVFRRALAQPEPLRASASAPLRAPSAEPPAFLSSPLAASVESPPVTRLAPVPERPRAANQPTPAVVPRRPSAEGPEPLSGRRGDPLEQFLRPRDRRPEAGDHDPLAAK